jgi:hypothetical protein
MYELWLVYVGEVEMLLCGFHTSLSMMILQIFLLYDFTSLLKCLINRLVIWLWMKLVFDCA